MSNDIHSSRWTKLSKQVRKEENYQCAVEGCERAATTTDHIIPRHRGGSMWDRDNLQAMCEHHNSSKQDKEAGDIRITWFNSDWFTEEYIEVQMKGSK